MEETVKKSILVKFFPYSIRCILCATLIAGISAASQAAPTPRLDSIRAELQQIEAEIWMSESADFQGLESRLIRYMQIHPSSALVHYLLAHYYLRVASQPPFSQKFLLTSRELSLQAITLSPSQDYGYVGLALWYDYIDKPEKGMKALSPVFNKGSKVARRSWRSFFTMGKLQSATAKTSQVLRLFKIAMTMEKGNHKIVAPFVIASLRDKHKDNTRFVQELRSWERQFPNETFKQMLAAEFIRRSDYAEAATNYQSILKANPVEDVSLINLGFLYVTHLKKRRQGYRLLKQVLGKADLTPDKSALAHLYYGEGLLAEGKVGEAEKHFEQVLNTSPTLEYHATKIYESYEINNKLNRLVKFLGEYSVHNKGIPYVHGIMAQVYSDKLRKFDLAINSFQDAILLNSDIPEYYEGLGVAYYRVRNFESALSAFDYALQLNPESPTALYNRACMLAILKRPKEALAALGAAFSVRPQLKKSARNDQDLRALHNLNEFKIMTDNQLSH